MRESLILVFLYIVYSSGNKTSPGVTEKIIWPTEVKQSTTNNLEEIDNIDQEELYGNGEEDKNNLTERSSIYINQKFRKQFRNQLYKILVPGIVEHPNLFSDFRADSNKNIGLSWQLNKGNRLFFVPNYNAVQGQYVPKLSQYEFPKKPQPHSKPFPVSQAQLKPLLMTLPQNHIQHYPLSSPKSELKLMMQSQQPLLIPQAQLKPQPYRGYKVNEGKLTKEVNEPRSKRPVDRVVMKPTAAYVEVTRRTKLPVTRPFGAVEKELFRFYDKKLLSKDNAPLNKKNMRVTSYTNRNPSNIKCGFPVPNMLHRSSFSTKSGYNNNKAPIKPSLISNVGNNIEETVSELNFVKGNLTKYIRKTFENNRLSNTDRKIDIAEQKAKSSRH